MKSVDGKVVATAGAPATQCPDVGGVATDCPRCGGEKQWEDCWNCEDGFSGHDCGEDCCCCLDPEENVVCDICRGDGGFLICRCATEARTLGTESAGTGDDTRETKEGQP